MKLILNVNLLFPVPGLDKSGDKRLGLFVDSGQIYGDRSQFTLSNFRTTAGLAFNWFTVIGPLSLSYGVPLNAKDGDQIKKFQVTLGTMFQ